MLHVIGSEELYFSRPSFFCAVYNRLFICRCCCCCCLNFIFIALWLALAPAPGMKVLRQAVFCLCVPSFWLAGCILLLLLFLAVTSFTHWLAGWLAFYRAKFCLALIIWCCCCKKVNICHFCELSERFEQRGGGKLAVMLLLLIRLLLQNVLFLSFFFGRRQAFPGAIFSIPSVVTAVRLTLRNFVSYSSLCCCCFPLLPFALEQYSLIAGAH